VHVKFYFNAKKTPQLLIPATQVTNASYENYATYSKGWLKYLMALLFIILHIETAFASKITYADSIYQATTKEDRVKKLLFLPIADFENQEDLKSVEAILKNHPLGGIIIQNGDIEAVQKWITDQKNMLDSPPLFILDMADMLDFPLTGLPKLPSASQLEWLSKDSLILEYGLSVGHLVRSAGFDMVMIDPSVLDSTLNFDLKNTKWINHYLQGISDSSIKVIFGNAFQIPNINFQFSLEKINQNLQVSGIIDHKIKIDLKPNQFSDKHRSQANYDGIVLRNFRSSENWNSFFNTGNDVLILPGELRKSIEIINYFSSEKRIKDRTIKRKFKRIVGAQEKKKTSTNAPNSIHQIINKLSYLSHKILLGSVACLKNKGELLPFKNLDQSHFASITGNSKSDKIFRKYLDKYNRIAHYNFEYIQENEKRALFALSHFDIIIVNITSEDEGDDSLLRFLKGLNLKSKIVINYLGKYEQLSIWSDFEALILAPENLPDYARLLPQYLFGAVEVSGIFPYQTVPNYDSEKPVFIENIGRLSYDYPAYQNIDIDILGEIDLIVNNAIATQTMPGCQVMMIKNDAVVYEKSFGYFTYDSLIKVKNHSVYDIASITKVVATLPAIMFLNDNGQLELEGQLGDYLSNYENTDKSNITIKNLLRHQSGLRSYLPFWKKAETKNGVDFRYKIPRRKKGQYKNKNLNIIWKDSIQYWISESEYNSLQQEDGSYGYLYSDLGFMVLKDLVVSQLNQPIDKFLIQNIYAPLGMMSTVYKPLCSSPRNEIVPTEIDKHLREELVWGNVHDRNAALIGGVSGHAGLFSNANDLGKYLQMHLRNGYYGGNKYFSSNIIKRFTTKLPDSKRRALGWDKPDKKVNNVSKYASESSYGHTGFTGTMVWVDPKHDFIYVFLSNRVYPNAKNNKLSENNIRTMIQHIMYESFLKF